MSFYVFDLDGTLADCEHRVKAHLTGPQKDWRAFFAACPGDTVIPHVRALLWALWHGGHRVEIWSGRSDEVRAETEAWLAANSMRKSLLTKMRKAGDHRPDDVVKAEFLDPAAPPDVIFDDRARVVKMWRAKGIPCFQVADGDF